MHAISDQLAYQLPPSLEEQARFITAALASDGVNIPTEALSAIAPFIAQPIDNLLINSGNDPERIHPACLTDLYTDAGTFKVLTVRLAGCAGSTWERNVRQSTSWASAADPTAAESTNALPALVPYEGADGVGAALCVDVFDADHAADMIRRASDELLEREGNRSYNLTADLSHHGQIDPCLMVAQLYRTPDGGFWAWPAVAGNNRTKARHTLLQTDPADLVTGVMDLTAWLDAWAQERNAQLSSARADGDSEHPTQRGLNVASFPAQLVVGCPTPERLYAVVQASNRRDHIHTQLDFSKNNEARSLGCTVISAYVANGLIDTQLADVLTGDAPVTALREYCDRPEAGNCELRDMRSQLLLAAMFPTIGQQERRGAIREAMSEDPPMSLLEREHVRQRLRVWSAMDSMAYSVAWNPRVGDNAMNRDTGRAGFVSTGRRVAELLACALGDDEALDELLAWRGSSWLAAYGLADADRGSMGAQINRANEDGDEDSDSTDNGTTRVRRGMDNALKAMRANRVRGVGLLREIARAMDHGELPRRVDERGEPLPEQADRIWFDQVFPKNSAARQRITPPNNSLLPKPGLKPRPQVKPPVAVPLEPDEERYERAKAKLRVDLEEFEAWVDRLPSVVADVMGHARAAEKDLSWTGVEAVRIVARAENAAEKMRQTLAMILPPDTDYPA